MNRDVPRTALDSLGRGRRVRLAALAVLLTAVELAGALVRRLLDVAVALVLTLATAPVALATMAAARARGRPALASREYLGRWQKTIELSFLCGPRAFRRIPWLWAVLRGDLSLVGPAPLPREEAATLTARDLPRFQVRPGLAHLYRVRQAANIAFEGRSAADLEQLHTATFGRDLGLLLRAIPATLIGAGGGAPPRVLDLLGVRVDNWTMEEAVGWLLTCPRQASCRQLAFVNPDCLNRAYERSDYRAVLADSDIVLPDGIGIHYAARMQGTALAANVNGTDLFPRLCDALADSGQSIYLLGGRPDVVEALAAGMATRWPRTRVAGYQHGFFARGGGEEREVVAAVNASGADILLVAFGAPAQELWIAAHRNELTMRVALGVGGLFDFYSGRIPRAPAWLRELGLEWTWRLLQEPRRMWRRYIIGNPLFLYRVWKWRRRTGG